MMKDIRVLELASVLAAPAVGQFFAELGASVIKIENSRTGGDVTRTWRSAGEATDDRSAYFCSVNWGKRSVAVDLTAPEGREIVYQLVRTADIVITSYKPGDAEKLGMDYKTLSSLQPGLIYGKVTGYGPANPRVGYDAVIQAESGFMFMNGEMGGASLKMPVALMDILAAHHLKEGLLLALLQREKTGKGCEVEVSLIQAAIASLANQATNWLVAGKLPQKQGSSHPNIAPYGDVFITADKKEILLAVGSDRQFADLCCVLEAGDLASDPAFSTNEKRVVNRDRLNARLRGIIAGQTAPGLLAALHAANVPAGIIRNVKEVFEMPEAQELLLRSGQLAGVRNFVAWSPSFHPATDLLQPPGFGEHTLEVLQNELNYDSGQIRRLAEARVIHIVQ